MDWSELSLQANVIGDRFSEPGGRAAESIVLYGVDQLM
jgi:hypothetical protein